MERHGLAPHVSCYNAAIKSAAAGGMRARARGGIGGRGSGGAHRRRWEIAVGFLREMSEKGIAPNAATYTAAMTACKNDGEPEVALALLKEISLSASEGDEEERQEKGEEGGVNGGGDGVGVGNGNHTGTGTGTGTGDGIGNGTGNGNRKGSGKVVPNVIHYGTVMSAFAERGDGWKKVMGLIKTMEASCPTDSFFLFFSQCTKSQQVPGIQ